MTAPPTIRTRSILLGTMLPPHAMQGAPVTTGDRGLAVQRRCPDLPRRAGVPAEPLSPQGGHMAHITRKAIGKVALAATLLLGVAACASQPGGPPAATPSSSQMSLPPTSTTPPGSSAGQGNMGSMPGHDMSGMPGQGMGGMDMQQMMAHCQKMRAQARQGTMSPQMQQMMQHCQMMNH